MTVFVRFIVADVNNLPQRRPGSRVKSIGMIIQVGGIHGKRIVKVGHTLSAVSVMCAVFKIITILRVSGLVQE